MHEYNAKLQRVVDGDTIDVEIDLGFSVFVKRRVRFYAMDAWESRTRDLEEKKKGLAAKERVKELFKEQGDDFILISHELGKYGRVLGTIVLSGDKNLNEMLIEEGHAYAYDGGNKEEARERASNILANKES
tara:strand:+ start:83 stop:478 length:396 start_codon:yes stop_codon:yes gene_type:complete